MPQRVLLRRVCRVPSSLNIVNTIFAPCQFGSCLLSSNLRRSTLTVCVQSNSTCYRTTLCIPCVVGCNLSSLRLKKTWWVGLRRFCWARAPRMGNVVECTQQCCGPESKVQPTTVVAPSAERNGGFVIQTSEPPQVRLVSPAVKAADAGPAAQDPGSPAAADPGSPAAADRPSPGESGSRRPRSRPSRRQGHLGGAQRVAMAR